MKYRREIDGLRALAILPVILFHAGFAPFGGGFVGVDVFFVISGYLITTIILAELEQGRFSLVNFYERRARRILPALFLVMLACLPFAWAWLLPDDMEDFSQSLIAVPVFASNILFWRQNGYFDTAAELKPLLHTWSLAVEEQYYVLFPLFLMLFWRIGKRWLLAVMAVVFVVSLMLAEWASVARPAAAFYLLPPRGWELLIGAFAAFYLARVNRAPFGRGLSEVAGWTGLALILYAVFAYSKDTPFPGFYALVPTVGSVLIILFATHETTVGRLVGNRVFVGIGLVSFSAYLWHQPLFAFARYIFGRYADETEPGLVVFGLLSVVSFALAWLSWRFVETPFRHKGTFGRRAIFTFALAGSLFFIAVGLYGTWRQGDVGRYPRDVIAFFQLKTASDAIVWPLKDQLRGAPFDPAKPKILVIGDSNSGDFINTLAASPVTAGASLSSLFKTDGCGNLYMPRTVFLDRVDPDSARVCPRNDDLLSDRSRQLMAEADVVFFASNWRDWEADLMPESYASLQAEFGDKFWFVGTKHVDFIPRDHVARHENTTFPALVPPDDTSVAINRTLKAAVGDRLIDPLAFFCGPTGCDLLTPEGDLIFIDGFHLTKVGVAAFADRLEATLTGIMSGL
jgi:peptidoglycan/LPS O-acetylase OafA/YrhL